MKKNKKLFAILTLVAFMMTLVPAFAFAASTPTLQKAEITNATTITLTFNGNVEAEGTANDVDLTVSGATVSNVAASNRTVTLTVDAVPSGNFKVSYSAGTDTSNYLKGAESTLELDSFEVELSNAAPKLVSATVENSDKDALVLTFDQTVSGSVNNDDFIVTGASLENTPSVSEKTVTLDLKQDVVYGDVLTVQYKGTALESVTNQKVASFTSDVKNNVDRSPVKEDLTISVFGTKNASVDVNLGGNGEANVPLNILVKDTNGNDLNGKSVNITIWAEDVNNPGVPTTALKGIKVGSTVYTTANTDLANAYDVTVNNASEFSAIFTRSGEYNIYAAVTGTVKSAANVTEVIRNATKLKVGNSKIVINGTSTDPRETYTFNVKANNDFATGIDITYENNNTVIKDKYIKVDANGLNEVTVDVALSEVIKDDKNGDTLSNNRLIGKDITIDTNSANIAVNKTKATTDAYGKISFKVSGTHEGNYYIYLKVDGVEVKVPVQVGNTAAVNIDVDNVPTAPVALYTNLNELDAEFTLTDINGNAVTGDGVEGATHLDDLNDTVYVTFTEKPEGTTLKDQDIRVVWNSEDEVYKIDGGNKTFDKEGKYTIKVALDNGRYATATFEVKKFETPVALTIKYDQSSIELGGTTGTASVKYVDANGTTQNAINKVQLAATGYAIDEFNKDSKGTIKVKNDEKYLGQTITVTAVDTRYNLTATTSLVVAEDAQGIKFATDKAVIDANNKIDFSLVDSKGNVVAIGNDAKNVTVNFIVTAKPEGAKVSVNAVSGAEKDLAKTGKAQMALTSNVAGEVTVQAIVTADVPNTNNTGLTTKYYSGTQTFTVGKEFNDGTVVMTINSATMLVDGELVEIDAPAVIKDNRTFVPFRALSEAFGAQVEYDEATQTVTAVLDGKTVVLTIGSTVMTVNDEAVTIDVAPYIANSRTMVPVRAVAEAFGFDVEATFNADGSTAGVVFAR